MCARTRFIWRSYTQMARVGNDRVSLVPFVWENLHKAIKTVDENYGTKIIDVGEDESCSKRRVYIIIHAATVAVFMWISAPLRWIEANIMYRCTFSDDRGDLGRKKTAGLSSELKDLTYIRRPAALHRTAEQTST